MKRFFSKYQILTVPNLLSAVRLAMIPMIVWLYSFEKKYYASIGMILLSGLTDVVDGWIARHFNMVSDFGKALDPLADKLTQGALLLCLMSKYKLMWALVIVFGICEIAKLTLGIVIAKRHDKVNSAKWYGKLNTVFIYLTVMLLILFPNMRDGVSNFLMIACGGLMIIAHALYFRLYCKILKGKDPEENSK